MADNDSARRKKYQPPLSYWYPITSTLLPMAIGVFPSSCYAAYLIAFPSSGWQSTALRVALTPLIVLGPIALAERVSNEFERK